MIQKLFLPYLELFPSVQLPTGGYPYHSGETARPDATAWTIILMSACEFADESCARGRAYLRSLQATNGSISIAPSHPDASWPTSLAILAWQGDSSSHKAQSLATNYLLTFTGQHFPNPDPSIIGHDTAILGWPWIAHTHSWVVPTALALMALQEVGFGNHPRIIEGHLMLVNRQLTNGGWNFGSTTVFGRELHPLPECTAIALQALAGTISIREIERSLNYLLKELPHLRTPLSLGWALLGLGAWDLKPGNAEELAWSCLQRQKRYGSYSYASLALLLCAVKASHGLTSLFRASPQKFFASDAPTEIGDVPR